MASPARDDQDLTVERETLWGENRELRQKLQQLKRLEKENEELKEEREKMQMEMKQQEKENEELKEGREKMQLDMKQMQTENAELSGKLENHIAYKSESEFIREELLSGIHTLRKQMQRLENEKLELIRKQNDVEIVRGRNTQLEQQQNALEKFLEKLKENGEKRQLEMAQFKKENKDKIEHLLEYILEFDEKYDELLKDNQKLRQARLETENADLRKKQTECEVLQKENAQLKQQQEELEKEIEELKESKQNRQMKMAQLKNENAQLTDKLDHHIKVERESELIREELLSEIQMLVHKTQKLENENVELSRKQDDVVSLEAKYTRVEQQRKELEQYRNKLREDNMKLQMEMTQLKQSNAQLSDKLEHHIEAKHESEKIREDLLSEIQNLSHKTQKLEDENENAGVRRRSNVLQDVNKNLELSLTKLKKVLDKLIEEKKKMQMEMKTLIKENAQLSTQQEQLTADKRDLETQYENLLGERENFVNQNSAMHKIQHNMLENALQSNERLTKENEELIEKMVCILELARRGDNDDSDTKVDADNGRKDAAEAVVPVKNDYCYDDVDDASSDDESSMIIHDLSNDTNDSQTDL